MSDHDDPQHRAYHQPDVGRVVVREADDQDDVFVVRMPIASTGEVRNQGDDPLTRDELAGMAEQIEAGGAGVFLDHGSNMDISGSRYSAVGKVGEWQSPELTDNSAGETLLEAGARMMDPETLSESTGSVREALAALKAQVDRDIGLSSSIGWRDDDSSPGGVDLMEASIVGIPADPRTTSQNAAAAMARAVVMGPDADDHRHLSSQQASTAETLLNAYRDEQGNGSVENFESWLWNVAYYQFDDNEFHAAQTALQEFYRETTPLEEPVGQQFIPYLEGQQGDGGEETETNNMSDSSNSGDDAGDDRDAQDDMDAAEYRESMLEMQRTQTETLSTLADALREDGDGDDDDDEDDEDDDDGDMDDQSSDDPDDTQSLTVDGEEFTVDDVRELHDGLGDAEPDTEADGDRDAEDEQTDGRAADPKDLL